MRTCRAVGGCGGVVFLGSDGSVGVGVTLGCGNGFGGKGVVVGVVLGHVHMGVTSFGLSV